MPEPPTEKLTFQTGLLLSPPSLQEGGRGVGPRTYRARFIRAGRVRAANGELSNVEVTPEAIQSAAARLLFDKKAVFIDHAGWFENPSLGRLAGVTKLAAYNAADLSIEGLIQLNDTPSGQVAASLLDDLLSDPDNAPDVGLSLSFYPVWESDASVGAGLVPAQSPALSPDLRRIVDITHIESVDLVFQPAADGRILQALSSVRAGLVPAHNPTLVPAQSQAQPTKGTQPMPEPVTTTTPITETSPTVPAPSAAPVGAGLVPAQEPTQEWLGALARTVTRQVLTFSGLPQASQDRLAEGSYETPALLEAAIEKERTYLASLVASNVVQIGNVPPRSPQVTGVRTSLDRIQLALDALFAGVRPANDVPPLSGIRELYHLLSGDYEMTGMFQTDRMQFANVNSSTMANLVANVLNKRVVQEFQNYVHWWDPIVLEEDFQSLQAIKWTVLGGVGELPTVAEGAAYTELTWADKGEAGAFVKKGGYLGLTLEAIDKDDTGRIRNAPRALAQAAWLTLSKAVSGIFTQASGVGPTLADTYALFESAHHANLGTTALSISSFNAARLAMRKQTELASGERLGALVTPKYLLVPPDLEITALQVLATEFDYTYALSNGVAAPVNPNADGAEITARMNAARSRVIVVDLWTDTNDWAAVCDPRLYSTIGIGYRYGRVPEIFSVASPTAGLMFTNDTMPIKVRFVFAVAPIDYRGMYKANV